MVGVLAGDGEAEVAALLVAVELGVAEVPAARALVDVAADGADLADVGRGNGAGRLRQGGVVLPDRRGGLDRRQRRQGADCQPLGWLELDPVAIRDGADIDERLPAGRSLAGDAVL